MINENIPLDKEKEKLEEQDDIKDETDDEHHSILSEDPRSEVPTVIDDVHNNRKDDLDYDDDDFEQEESPQHERQPENDQKSFQSKR